MGGDADVVVWAQWAVWIVPIIVVCAYLAGLRYLRKAARRQETQRSPKTETAQMTETELGRYSRHILLREIGGPGQQELRRSRVLVIGAGGLGAAVLQYLGAAGIGTLGVIDDDKVEASNLARQVIHRDGDIGTPKVFSAQAQLEAQNPFITIRPYHRRLTADIAETLFAEYDLIIDGSDNGETRDLVNKAALASKRPFISGAISQWEGQVALFHPAAGGACYRCVFPDPDARTGLSCAEGGVAGPLPGVIGSMMALEAIKWITKAGGAQLGRLVIYDGLYGETRLMRFAKDLNCPVCASPKHQQAEERDHDASAIV